MEQGELVAKAENWHFIPLGPNDAGGGDLSRIIRAGMPPAHVLAREVIQNSWDAARRLRRDFLPQSDIPFSVSFRFRELVGEEKEAFVSTFHLRELAERAHHVGHAKLMLNQPNVLNNLDSDEPLRVLEASDYGAHGLFGHPDETTDSILYQAIFFMGGSEKAEGMGGSYGFGKSAFIRGSRIRTVFAYSCFRRYTGTIAENDPVTRRFVGMAYWQNHRHAGKKFQGRAKFGEFSQAGPQAVPDWPPYEDGFADALAGAAGFGVRSPSVDADLGTSLLVVEPTVTPEALIDAIERYWWPALHDGDFTVSVQNYDGTSVDIAPEQRPELVPFIRAYKALSFGSSDDADGPQLLSAKWRNIRNEKLKPGDLAAVVLDPNDESLVLQEQVNGSEEGASASDILFQPGPLVALMRSPKMIVKYWDKSKSPVPIRGVYVASPDIDDLLRDTETVLHDDWTTSASDDIEPRSTQVASFVMSRIAAEIRRLAEVARPEPPSRDVGLPIYSKLLRKFLDPGGIGPLPPPPPGGEPISFHYVQRPDVELLDNNRIRLTCSFVLELRDDIADAPDALRVRVTPQVSIVEDEGSNRSTWPAELMPEPLSGFERDSDSSSPSSWSGILERAVSLQFEVYSEPYSAEWTASVSPEVLVLGPVVKELEVASDD